MEQKKKEQAIALKDLLSKNSNHLNNEEVELIESVILSLQEHNGLNKSENKELDSGQISSLSKEKMVQVGWIVLKLALSHGHQISELIKRIFE